MSRQLIGFVGLALFSFGCIGCQPTTKDANDFADGVAQLKTLHASIRDAFSSGGDPHQALHEVGDVLDNLPEFIDDAGLDEAGATSAKEAIDKMMDGYGEIDNSIHENKEPDYDSVSASLDEAMTTLEDLVGG